MIAALPMYDFPALEWAHDALWEAIRQELLSQDIDAPARLTRKAPLWPTWQNKSLLLGQSCALPFKQVLHGRVGYVGTFDYGLENMPQGYYASWLIVHRNDPRTRPAEFHNAQLAYNSEDSFSGWQAARNWALKQGIVLNPTSATGAHENSVRAVAEGRADIAAIDCVTWLALSTFLPAAQKIRILDRSAVNPGLPLITARGNDPAPIRNAVQTALTTVDPSATKALGIRALVELPIASYLSNHPSGA